MRYTTAEDYHSRLSKALDFVLLRLDESCTTEEVAAEAGFSRFHCHRIFRAMTGESISELVRRLRLERAAHRLRHEPVKVLDVALDAGYGSEEAFSRAFRRVCGMSPSRSRTAWPPPTFSGPLARVRYYPGQNRVEFESLTGGINMEVRIETFGEIEVARIRHTGPYNEVGACFARLLEWVSTTGAQPGRVLTLSYDDPDSVAPQDLRSDACVEVHTDVAPPDGISIGKLEAGRYAVYTHRGPYDGISEAYGRLFGAWLPQSGEEPDDRHCMEVYRNSPLDAAPAGLLTDLCLPLRSQ